MRVLPREPREHLHAIYAVARFIDELGDSGVGDRTALLHEFAADLSTIWTGGMPEAEVLRRLTPTVHACGLAQEPFDQLIAANLHDQTVTAYDTFADLL